jgi:steroid delta-isomerase-like uncharacterized protein
MTMSTEQNKQVSRRVFEEVLNTGDLARADDLFGAGYALHAAGFPGPLDRDGHKAFIAGLLAAFPDWEETIDEQIAAGDTVATRATGRGTHRAEFLGVPATGRRVEVRSVNVDRIVDGRIAERWLIADVDGMMRQLGVAGATDD